MHKKDAFDTRSFPHLLYKADFFGVDLLMGDRK
jgi:hypothetical protein